MKILPKKKSIKLKDSLFKAIASLKTVKEVKMFLSDLCTPAELNAMMSRWQVVSLIKAGKSYREIYAKTGVSVTTVGRVARYILKGEGGYNLIYERLIKKNGSRHSSKKTT